MRILLSVIAVAGWMASVVLSWMTLSTIAFASGGGMAFTDNDLTVQILLLAPIIVLAFAAGAWLLKRRSPWIELIILAAPLYQIVFVASRLIGGAGSPL